jgi:hypothetical protein
LEDVVEPWIGGLMPALKAAIDSSQSTAAVKADDDNATDAQPSSTTPADDVAQAMYGLSLDAASSPAAAAAAATTPAAATTAAPVKKKIIIRRAPQKEVPDLAPCPYTLAWAEQATTTTAPTYAPAIPASMPAASPLLNAELVGARYLSATDAVKPVLEVELRVPSDSGTPAVQRAAKSDSRVRVVVVLRHNVTLVVQVSSGCPAMRLRSCAPTPRTKSHRSSTD